MSSARSSAITVATRVTNEDSAWLMQLCQGRVGDTSSCLIANPANPPIEAKTLKTQVTAFQKKTKKLMLCNVPDTYYHKCFTDTVIQNYKLELLALQDISASAMEHLVSKLDFSEIKIIGIKNLTHDALEILFNRLATMLIQSRRHIPVLCGEGIAETWQTVFNALENPSPDFLALHALHTVSNIKTRANLKRSQTDSKPDSSERESAKKAKKELEVRCQKAEQDLFNAKIVFTGELLLNTQKATEVLTLQHQRIAQLESQLGLNSTPPGMVYSSDTTSSGTPESNIETSSTTRRFQQYATNQTGTWSASSNISAHLARNMFQSPSPSVSGQNPYPPIDPYNPSGYTLT